MVPSELASILGHCWVYGSPRIGEQRPSRSLIWFSLSPDFNQDHTARPTATILLAASPSNLQWLYSRHHRSTLFLVSSRLCSICRSRRSCLDSRRQYMLLNLHQLGSGWHQTTTHPLHHRRHGSLNQMHRKRTYHLQNRCRYGHWTRIMWTY